MTEVLPVMKPRFPDLTQPVARFSEIQKSGVFSNFGPQTRELEARLGAFIGAPPDNVVAVSNATAGLTAAVTELEGKSWLIPSWSFSATAAAAIQAGVDVTFGDINPTTQWLELGNESAFDGTILVAPFGSGFRDDLFDETKNRVIDAAASIAAALPDFRTMPESNIVVFSLHATKVLGIGEGGIVVCGSKDVAERVRQRVNFGFEDRQSIRFGFNGKMSEFQAAIGHLVMDNWETEKEEWQETRSKVLDIQEQLQLQPLITPDESITPYWMIDFRDETLRNLVEEEFERAQIQTRRWWGLGCYTMPAYAGISATPLPHTEDVASRYLGLPFFRGMSDANLNRIAETLSRVIR